MERIRDAMPPGSFRDDKDLFEKPEDVAFWAERIRELQALAEMEGRLQAQLEERLLVHAREVADDRHSHTILGNEARRWLSMLHGVKGNMDDGGYLLEVRTRDAQERMVERVLRRVESERIVRGQQREQEARESTLMPAARAVRARMLELGIERADPKDLAARPELASELKIVSDDVCGNEAWEAETEGGSFEISVVPEGLRIVEWEAVPGGRRKVYNMREIAISA